MTTDEFNEFKESNIRSLPGYESKTSKWVRAGEQTNQTKTQTLIIPITIIQKQANETWGTRWTVWNRGKEMGFKYTGTKVEMISNRVVQGVSNLSPEAAREGWNKRLVKDPTEGYQTALGASLTYTTPQDDPLVAHWPAHWLHWGA